MRQALHTHLRNNHLCLSNSQPVVTEPRPPVPQALSSSENPPASLPSSSTNFVIFCHQVRIEHLEYTIPIRGRDDVAAALNCYSRNDAHDSATASGVKLDKSKTPSISICHLQKQDS